MAEFSVREEENNDLWLQQKLSSPVAHKLHGSSWQLAVRRVAKLHIKAHGPLQLHNPQLRLGRHAEGSN